MHRMVLLYQLLIHVIHPYQLLVCHLIISVIHMNVRIYERMPHMRCVCYIMIMIGFDAQFYSNDRLMANVLM